MMVVLGVCGGVAGWVVVNAGGEVWLVGFVGLGLRLWLLLELGLGLGLLGLGLLLLEHVC